MPRRADYEDQPLGHALRQLAEHHYAQRTRHLSHDEYLLLMRAADVIDRTEPALQAFT